MRDDSLASTGTLCDENKNRNESFCGLYKDFPDTLRHRLLECSYPNAVSLRMNIVKSSKEFAIDFQGRKIPLASSMRLLSPPRENTRIPTRWWPFLAGDSVSHAW